MEWEGQQLRAVGGGGGAAVEREELCAGGTGGGEAMGAFREKEELKVNLRLGNLMADAN